MCLHRVVQGLQRREPTCKLADPMQSILLEQEADDYLSIPLKRRKESIGKLTGLSGVSVASHDKNFNGSPASTGDAISSSNPV